QMYRQHVPGRIEGSTVVKFLLQDRFFPRAVAHAAAEAEISLKNLPRNEAPLRRVATLRGQIEKAEIDRMDFAAMHAFIDALQQSLNQIHDEIFRTWFYIQQPVR